MPDRTIEADDKSAAWGNTVLLSGQLAAGVAALPLGTIYINGTIATKPTVGCGRITTPASTGYPVDGHPTLTGARTRIVQLGKGPMLRISGAGFVLDDPLEWVGDGESAIIEVEGRDPPATGRHRFKNQVFANAGTAIKCLAGYYDVAGKFVANENHADNSIVDGCEEFNCGTFFRSENQQAVNWKFRDCVLNWTGGKSCVAADLVRGGNITFDGLAVNDPRATLFRLRDYSPNNCRLVCRDLHVDRCPGQEFYTTLVDYQGLQQPFKWSISIDGFIATHVTDFDATKLYVGCEGLPRDDWKIELYGLPAKEKP